ncbi:MAG: Oxalate decarboxylase/archaeal phosphoglucose isomerase [Candidatus Alkanophagales archaeon MCA70_species_2]|nr:Oxalate decarboxylase/archaeal phosphoglucose isomerase [Candidatus Alkanophaga liquidiphilum]
MRDVRVLKLGGREFRAEVRMLDDMRAVLYDEEFRRTAENVPLYYMFRDVYESEEDAAVLKRRGLRYDITIIPPRTLGKEFVKTAGHYHPKVPGSDHTYAELYEVLEGEAHFLLQKLEADGSISDVVVVKAKSGNKMVVPPNYGHVTINPAKKTLKMANLVFKNFSSIYEPYREKGGAAYFELTDGDFVRNENYGELPELRFLEPPRVKELSRRIYELIDEPLLEFLKNPSGYEWLFEKALRRDAS